jgi:hypothetical protein
VRQVSELSVLCAKLFTKCYFRETSRQWQFILSEIVFRRVSVLFCRLFIYLIWFGLTLSSSSLQPLCCPAQSVCVWHTHTDTIWRHTRELIFSQKGKCVNSFLHIRIQSVRVPASQPVWCCFGDLFLIVQSHVFRVSDCALAVLRNPKFRISFASKVKWHLKTYVIRVKLSLNVDFIEICRERYEFNVSRNYQ